MGMETIKSDTLATSIVRINALFPRSIGISLGHLAVVNPPFEAMSA